MQSKILHHLFLVVSSDVIKAPLWDVAAQGPTAYPNNSTYVNQQVSRLLTESFPNMQPRQVEVRFSHLLIFSTLHPLSCPMLYLLIDET